MPRDRAAALANLDATNGLGARIWARAVEDELARFEEAIERFTAGTVDDVTWDRIHGAAVLLSVSIAQVLAFERRVQSLTGDAQLKSARDAFDRPLPQRSRCGTS